MTLLNSHGNWALPLQGAREGLCAYSLASGIHVFGDRNVLEHFAHPKQRHVAVDGFIVTLRDFVGFVPNTDAAVTANSFHIITPWFEVGVVRVSSKFIEVIERAPIRHEHRRDRK